MTLIAYLKGIPKRNIPKTIVLYDIQNENDFQHERKTKDLKQI